MCPLVNTSGNPCGGVPYAISRGALESLVYNGKPASAGSEARLRASRTDATRAHWEAEVDCRLPEARAFWRYLNSI